MIKITSSYQTIMDVPGFFVPTWQKARVRTVYRKRFGRWWVYRKYLCFQEIVYIPGMDWPGHLPAIMEERTRTIYKRNFIRIR